MARSLLQAVLITKKGDLFGRLFSCELTGPF